MPSGLFDIAPLEPLVRQGYTILTPNQRLARRIKSEWDSKHAASGARVWPRVAVYPLESWLFLQWQEGVRCGRLPSMVPLQAGQALEVWRQVVVAYIQSNDSFQLLRPEVAAEFAQTARDLLIKWRVDWQLPAIRQQFQLDQDCRVFLDWLDSFDKRLERDGALTQGDCLQQLADAQGASVLGKVALVECDDIPPLVSHILHTHCDDLQQVEVGHRQAVKRQYPCVERRAELQAVADWAVQQHGENPDVTIGIVLSDMEADRTALEYLLRRAFDSLGRNYNALPVNFSTGIRLSKAPMVRDALRLLATCRSDAETTDIVALLYSRFLDMPDAQSPLAHKFVRRLYAIGESTINSAELRYLANELSQGEQKGLLLGQHLLATYRMRELQRSALPSVWVTTFSNILSVWGWPSERALDSLEYQQAALWIESLDAMRSYDAVCSKLDFRGALRLLNDICERQVSQPRTDDSAIHVLGPLEAVGLAFDHLWICGMQATNWPTPPRPNPFIPPVMQSALDFPHATSDREWQFSQARMSQYRRTVGVLHASYSLAREGVPDLPSPLLQDFETVPVADFVKVDSDWQERQAGQRLECLVDDRAPAIPLGSAHSGGSALLEDQSQCPFRAFARRRLEVEPLPEPSVGLSPAERGTLLHEALYRLWGELGDQAALLELDGAAQEEAVHRSVKVVIAEATNRIPGRFGPGYWQLEADRLFMLLQEWLAIERQRSGFVVLLREADITLQLAQLEIRLRIDRVDELADGSRLIIDYKSGRSSAKDWMGDRPARPQLLLYSIAAPEETGALAFATVRPRQSAFVGLGRVEAAPGISTDLRPALKAGMEVDDWDELNLRWRANLEALAQAFVDGDAAVDPLAPASCAWCGLEALCRIDRSPAGVA